MGVTKGASSFDVDGKTLSLIWQASSSKNFSPALQVDFGRILGIGGAGIDEVVEVLLEGSIPADLNGAKQADGSYRTTYRRLLQYAADESITKINKVPH